MLLTPKSYSQAFCKSASLQEPALLNVVIHELSDFTAAARQTHLLRHLTDRLTPLSGKQEFLTRILSHSDFAKETQALLFLLLAKNHLLWLPALIRQLKEERFRRFHIEEGEVIACAPLDAAEKQRAQNILEKLSGSQILLAEKVNSAILGGLVLRLGDTLIDGSILKKIRTLKNLLTA